MHNLFFIMIDDLRTDYEKLTSGKAVNLKKFVSRGVFFKNLFTHAPETYLSCGTFMSGIYPFKHKSGMEKWNHKYKTVYHYLEKSHIPYMQVHYGPFGTSMNVEEHRRLMGWTDWGKWTVDVRPNAEPSLDFLHRKRGSLTNVYIQFLTLRQLEKIMHDRIDHTCEKGDIKKVIDAYKEAILQVDIALGEIYNYLEKNKLFENTVIVVTSDHGESFKLYDNHILGDTGAAWVLHNGSRYDETIRIPLILIAPDLEPGSVEAQVRQIDIMPTFMHLLGVETKNTDGEILNVHNPSNIKSKDVFIGMTTETKKQAIRLADGWKMIFDQNKIELYDTKIDPGEQRNLASHKKEKVAEMFGLLRALPKDMVYSPETIFFRYSDYKNLEYVEKIFRQAGLDEEWRNRSNNYNKISWVVDSQYKDGMIEMMQLNGSERILDVGCGTGLVLRRLYERYPRLSLYGIDASPSMLQKVDVPHFDLRVASATNLPFEDNFFDIVFARMILHHLLGFKLERGFREMMRVSRYKILIAESVPIRDDLIEDFKYFLNEKEERRYFTSEDIKWWFDKFRFKNVATKEVFLRSQSIKNWLDNTSTPEKMKALIYKRHREVSDEYKKAANFQFKDDDVFVDMRHFIIIGEGPR